MSPLGLAIGLLSALLSAGVYLASRSYVVHTQAGEPQPQLLAVRLMAVGQLLVALLCIPGALLLEPGGVTYGLDSVSLSWIKPLIMEAICFTLGNIAMFLVLRMSDASQVTPLLGLKLVALAVLAPAMIAAEHMDPVRMGAVLLVMVAAFLLRDAGGRLPLRAWILLMFTCLAFALADIHIRISLDAARVLAPPATSSLKLHIFCAIISNLISGVIALAVLPFTRPWRIKDWSWAMPYAGTMLATKLTYFVSIGLTSVMLAVILQSFRGLFAILLGVAVAWLGHTHVETRHKEAVVARRLIAAALISASVVVYMEHQVIARWIGV